MPRAPDGSRAEERAQPRPRAQRPGAPQLPGDVVIIGLGVIGGSLARVLVRQGVSLSAWAESDEDRRLAAAAGIPVADGPGAAAEAARQPATVVLAVPLASVRDLVARLAEAHRADTIIFHTAGLQRRDALGLDDALVARVLGTHPIAGSHQTGFGASSADLFAGADVSVESRAADRLRDRAEALWRLAGAGRMTYRTAEDHDRLMAWVSHLPQLAATALAASLEGAGIAPADAGPGARDTTRLAESPLALWTDLLRAAPPDTTAALRRLRQELELFERALVHGDPAALAPSWESASVWRRAAGRGR